MPGFEVIDRSLAVIQSNLAAIGVKVTLETADWGTFYPSLLQGNWDMDLNRWTYSDPSILTVLFRSPGHRKMTAANPAQDETLDRCDTLMNTEVRFKCVSEAQNGACQEHHHSAGGVELVRGGDAGEREGLSPRLLQ